MARNNMTIVVKVKDQATAQIKSIGEALKELGSITGDVASKFQSLGKLNLDNLDKSAKTKKMAMSAAEWSKKQTKNLSDEDFKRYKERTKTREIDLSSLNKHLKKEDLLTKQNADQKLRSERDLKKQVNLVNSSLAADMSKDEQKNAELYKKRALQATPKQLAAFQKSIGKQREQAAKDAADAEKREQVKLLDQEKKVLAFKKAMNAQYMSEHVSKQKAGAAAAKKVEQQRYADVADAAKKSVIDMTQFNKTMFTTAAFVGMFTKAFKGFTDSIKEAAELDRLDREYQRVFGDSGTLITDIKDFTTTAVDRMEAMRSAIALGQLGIAKNSKEAGDIIGMAATAAKMAGKSTTEGIEKVTEALKTGSLGALEFLNEIRGADPALKAYLETLHRAGGALGGAMTAQAKYNLVLNMLRVSTRGHLKDETDLVDVVTEATNSFGFMRMSIGRLLGAALGPLISKVSVVVDHVTEFIDRLRTSDKTFPSFIRNVALMTTNLAGLLATAGTLRLLFKGIAGLGIGGLPMLAAGFLGLGQIFGQADSVTESLAETFKSFGSVAAGVFQLVQSFIMDPENFAKGIGKMDRSLHDFLEKKGLLNLTSNMAKAAAVIVNFSIQVGKALSGFYETYIEPIVSGLNKLFGLGGKTPLSRKFLGDEKGKANPIHDLLVSGTAAAVAGIAANVIYKNVIKRIPIVGGLLSNVTSKGLPAPLTNMAARIPIIGPMLGRMLGAGKGQPKGTPDDPLYVKDENSGVSSALPGLGSSVTNFLSANSEALKLGGAFFALAAVVETIIALEKQEIEAKQAVVDKADDWEKTKGRISGMFPNGFVSDESAQNFSLGPAAQARAIVTAQVPEPMSSETMNTLEEDIRKIQKEERNSLVEAITASKTEKEEMRSVLEDPVALADLIEKAINKSRVSKKKPTHSVKSGRC